MRVFNGIEEYSQAVGSHLGTTDWVQITQEKVNLFADATNDHQWIHIDTERAKNGPFGGTIAHGYLTISMVPELMAQIARVDGLQLVLNYGSNKVRFRTPVPVGSRVRGSAELASLTPVSLGLQAITLFTVELEGSAKPACVAEIVSVLVP